MPDSDVLDPTDQVGSYEDDLAKKSTRDESQEKNAKGENLDPGQRKRLGHDEQGKGKIRKGIAAVRDPLRGARDKVKNLDPREKIRNLRKQISPTQLAKKGAEEIAKKAAAAAASSPVGWVIGIAVFVLIIILVVIISATGAGALQNGQLKITKTGPATASLNDPLPYQIDVAYPGTATDIIVQDHLPDNTDYVDSAPPAKFDPATRTAVWNLKDFVASQGGVLTNPSASLKINLKATADNSTLVNQAQGEVIGAGTQPNAPSGGAPIADGYVPYAPSSNNCSGKYDFSKYPEQNPLGNYGDPQCNFSKDSLYKLLQSKESNPEFVHIWFDVIIPEESGYSPQAWAPPVGQQLQLDSGGAWGLYQMGSSNPPGQSPPSPGQNGVYDRGDVNWELQTSNAYNDWKIRNHCNFYPYWGSYQRSGLPNVNHC